MSGGDFREQFLYNLPSSVLWEFCKLMDGLSDLDWTGFASEVLHDQADLRYVERKASRTDWVMNKWANMNGKVGELLDLLERLRLFRPRDVILGWTSSYTKSSSLPPARPPPPPASASPSQSDRPPPPPPSFSPSQFDHPPKSLLVATPTQLTCKLGPTDEGGGRPLPRPAPPPASLQSNIHQRPKTPPLVEGSVAMNWLYEEVYAGTDGFSPARQVGEGGFGVVYRATVRNTDCAVKRLKQDCLLDWTLLKESFKTEVEKLSKFRHPNIVDLLGYSEGQGSMCVIYSYMENRSLEDQLHNERRTLSWSQRVNIVKGASKALAYLHSPPDGREPVIHGDVKSSNILLDTYLEAKLADFGLARFAPHNSSGHTRGKTTVVGITETVRGTLAYLPDEYVRKGELGTAVDVFSFGVVLLEVLTGRRALEIDMKSRDVYLKNLVGEIQDSPNGSTEAEWRKHLDHRLLSGGAAEPADCMKMVALACRCLDRRKMRPPMTEVLNKLQEIHDTVRKTNSAPLPLPIPHQHLHSQSFPRPPRSLDSIVGALSHQLSTLGPLEDTCQVPDPSCCLAPPNPLHSSASLPPVSSSSFVGPCETDESRGFSQYDLRSQFSQFRSNGPSCRSLSPSTRDQYNSAAGPSESQISQPSVPTEDQYNFPPQPSGISERTGTGALTGASRSPQQGVTPEPEPTRQTTAGYYCAPEYLSPAASLQSLSPGPSVVVNPSKQRFLEKKTMYEEGRIQTPELLSSDDLYGGRSSEDFRGPEESDELDYLPAKHD